LKGREPGEFSMSGTNKRLAAVLFVAAAGILFLLMIWFWLGKSSSSLSSADYACRIRPSENALSAREGERMMLNVLLVNRGRNAWNPSGVHPCLLSYHLLDASGRVLRFDNPRYPLPGVIGPGERADLSLAFNAPLESGDYLLELDMVREGEAWFKEEGSPTALVRLKVRQRRWPGAKHPISLEYGKPTRVQTGSREGNALLKIIRLTLEDNAVSFQGRTGTVSGFSAGTDYPQIWLRDANTILPAARLFYGRPFLLSWLEEHLAFQRADGALMDWVDSRGRADKNTTETDQESSAVQAAFQVYEILGPSWLEKKIDGERIIDRLDHALGYVLRSRWSPEHGLVTGAHTADWGDVDMVDEGPEAVRVNGRTHWTADIYDQSMFYQACRNLAGMWRALGGADRSSFWTERAREIKANTNRWLWQEEKGFYRVHIHLDGMEHDFDESDMLAMGGNTQAMLSDLADETKRRRIIQAALERQETYGLSTVSGTILPPYPRGFFRHPLLDDPFEYQNGAQWDWFGGKLVYAMFENGFSDAAREKMLAIIRKNIRNGGFFEWDDREGVGRGSGCFAGSAGSMAMAFFEGYLGIRWSPEGIRLTPRIGKGNARAHAYFPANDVFVAFDYQGESLEKSLSLAFNSNFSGLTELRILLPGKKVPRSLLLDGKPTPWSIGSVGDDSYAIVRTDLRNHRLEIIFSGKSDSEKKPSGEKQPHFR